MSITLGGATSDRIDHGSSSTIDNVLTAFTTLMWVYPTTISDNRGFWSILLNSGTSDHRLTFSGTSGFLRTRISEGASATNYITNNNALSINGWYCVALSYEASGTGRAKIFVGTLTSKLTQCTYSTATDGTGASMDAHSSNSLIVGNRFVTGAYVQAFQGSISKLLFWSRRLSDDEIYSQQFVHRPTENCILYSEYGYNGTGSQPDWSGNLNNGTVTGGSRSAHVPINTNTFLQEYSYIPSAAPAPSRVPVGYVQSRSGIIHPAYLQ